MFENIDSTFWQGICFLAAGAFFGLCYEILRFFRMLIRHNTLFVFIEDTLFFVLCGFASFIIALWVGMGYFRIYYMVFEVFGASLYFLTAGRLLNAFLRRGVRALKKLIRLIYGKLKPKLAALFVPFVGKIRLKFSNIAEKLLKPIFNRKKHLKNADEILYNKNVHSAVQVNGGGEKSGVVIKAQIRKKT